MIKIRLQFVKKNEISKQIEFDRDTDSILTLLDAVCADADNYGNCKFGITGFGESEWPVDIDTDLPILLLQCTSALLNLSQHRDFEIDLYEQGMERLLKFNFLGGDDWQVSCVSNTEWEPFPFVSVVRSSEIESELQSTLDEFIRYLSEINIPSEWQILLEHWILTGKEVLASRERKLHNL